MGVETYHRWRAHTTYELGRALLDSNRLDDAVATLSQAMELCSSSYGGEDVQRVRVPTVIALAGAHRHKARLALQENRFRVAKALFFLPFL